MNKVLVVAGVVPLVVLVAALGLFLRRAIPLRRERPELLQRGLWFTLPHLLWPVTWLYALAVLPVAVLTALVCVFVPSPYAKRLFWFALGELTATGSGFAWLYLVNTYGYTGH